MAPRCHCGGCVVPRIWFEEGRDDAGCVSADVKTASPSPRGCFIGSPPYQGGVRGGEGFVAAHHALNPLFRSLPMQGEKTTAKIATSTRHDTFSCECCA